MAEMYTKVSNEHTLFKYIVCEDLSGYYQTYHYVQKNWTFKVNLSIVTLIERLIF